MVCAKMCFYVSTYVCLCARTCVGVYLLVICAYVSVRDKETARGSLWLCVCLCLCLYVCVYLSVHLCASVRVCVRLFVCLCLH